MIKLVWNKGLTSETDERVKKNTEAMKVAIKQRIEKGTLNPTKNLWNYAKKGKALPAWNKGLTKAEDERVAKHARTLKGREISEETCKKIRKARLKYYETNDIWNKGLTKEDDERLLKMGEAISKSRIESYKEGNWAPWNLGDGNYARGENNPNWRGGVSFEPYSPEFDKELKEQIRERDEYKCQLCGVHQENLPRALDIHHIDNDKKNDTLENLTSLCPGCHGLITGNNTKSEGLSWLV